MSAPNPKKRPRLAIVLSLMGGILILATGLGIVIIKSLALSGNLSPPLEGLVGQGYAPMVGTGFEKGLSYDIGVVADIVPGVVIIAGALMMVAVPSRASSFAYLVLVFAFLSLFGEGGLVVGAFLGILGGALGVTSRRSAPRLPPPPPPDEPIEPSQRLKSPIQI
jgi:hypothetical protein